MSDPYLAPGVSQSDLDGPKCEMCGKTEGCDCEPDTMTRRERIEAEKADIDWDR